MIMQRSCKWTRQDIYIPSLLYHLGRLGAMLEWSGAIKKRSVDWIAFLTAVEVLDGFSSMGCFCRYNCKCFGHFFCLGITMERTDLFFHHHAQYRPNVLGSSLAEQILKDYNGQTYWLSVVYTPSIKNP
jgi:hypothetical protein